MVFDLLSLPELFIITAIISAMLFIVVWIINRDLAGTRQWLLAIVSFPIALLLLSTQEMYPPWLSIFSANLLIALGALFVVIGTRTFFNHNDYAMLISSALLFPFIISFYYFTFITPNQSIRILIMSLFGIATFAISLYAAMSPQSPSYLTGRVIFGFICMLLIGLMLGRIYSVIKPSQVALMSWPAIKFLNYMAGFIIHYGLPLSLFILYDERKEQQLATLTQSFSQQQAIDKKHDPVIQSKNSIDTDEIINNQPSNSDKNKVQSRQQSDQQQIATSLPPQEEINNVVAISEQAPVTDSQQMSIDMLLQPNLLNQNLLLLKQKSTPDHEFTNIIKRLPQNLKQLTDAANKAFETAQFETLKSALHQLATSADQVGLEQLSEMALALEFRQSQEVTATDFTQLAQLCDASINKIQSSDLLN